MKKFAILLLALLLALPLAGCQKGQTDHSINVYNWGEYIDESIFDDFEAETGIHVNYKTFASNEMLYSAIKGGGNSYDVIIPSDYMVARMGEEGLLMELDYSKIPNAENIDERYLHPAYDTEQKYSLPYMWGTTGIIYNTTMVDKAPTSWMDLFTTDLKGQVLIFDNPRDCIGLALKALGYSFNTTNKDEIAEATDLLIKQKEDGIVQAYVMDQIFDKMERGEAWAAPYYAGDYLTMVEENPDLGFSHPQEGFNIFIDAMCIPKGCQNKAGAEAFINFLCRPDISAANLDYIGYSTPETAAKEYLDEEIVNDPVAYPDDETLARSESFAELSIEATQQMNDLWLSVKTSNSNTTLYLVLTIAAVVAVILFFTIQSAHKRRQKSRRCRKWKTQ